MNRQEMPLVTQLCHNAFDIMIVYEIIQMHVVFESHISLALNSMRYFKIVMIVMSTVKSFVQSIICHRVQGIVIYPATVISVNNLTHQPEIILQTISDASELTHESMLEHICSIKANAVDIKFRHPETHSVKMILSYLRVIQVELWEQIVATPVFIGKAIVILIISPEVYVAVPVSVPAVRSAYGLPIDA